VFNADCTIKFFNINAGKETIGRFAPTPVDLYFSNTILNGTYEAANLITVENNVTVIGPTILKAGNTINLKPGFTAGYGNNFTAMIEAVPNTANRYYYLKDHLGSIRVVVDEAGEIVSSDDYDPWGMILNGRSSNFGFANAKYKFTSKERDVETGYDYFGARYYDSRIGRWLSSDPLTDLSSSISPYAYCFNNPLNYTDPDGKWPWDEPNYIWDDELGRWRLRSIDEILAITGREKLNKYSAEYNGDNSLATTLLVTGVSTIAIGTTAVVGGLLGLITIGLSGDTDPHQRQLLMNEGAKEETPDTHPEKFDGKQIKGRSAKVNKETGEVWEVDKSGHSGGKHYEVYKNKRAYEKGERDRQVFPDGKTGKKY